MRKTFMAIMTAVVLSAGVTAPTFAQGWMFSPSGWWYSTNTDNTTWHSNGWQWLDGNNDGTAECYYFDVNGYCLMNTVTPDGFTVDTNGAWVVNGVVQTKKVEVSPANFIQSPGGSAYTSGTTSTVISNTSSNKTSTTTTTKKTSSEYQNKNREKLTTGEYYLKKVRYGTDTAEKYSEDESDLRVTVSDSGNGYKLVFDNDYYDGLTDMTVSKTSGKGATLSEYKTNYFFLYKDSNKSFHLLDKTDTDCTIRYDFYLVDED